MTVKETINNIKSNILQNNTKSIKISISPLSFTSYIKKFGLSYDRFARKHNINRAYLDYFVHQRHIEFKNIAEHKLGISNLTPEKLVAYRKEHNLTQAQLAKKIGCKQWEVSRYEINWYSKAEKKIASALFNSKNSNKKGQMMMNKKENANNTVSTVSYNAPSAKTSTYSVNPDAVVEYIKRNNMTQREFARNAKIPIYYFNYFIHQYNIKFKERAEKILKINNLTPKKLIEYREQHNLTQQDLANKLKTNKWYVSRYEINLYTRIEKMVSMALNNTRTNKKYLNL